MTGETHEIRKDVKTPFMLSGCQVTSGTGQMVVTGVGVLSEWGMTLSKLTEERDPTPLQDKLENVAGAISKAGVAVACLTFVALTIIWIVKIAQGGWNWDRLNELVSFFIIGVAIIAVAVPEGLPLAVTIALAYSMKKMYVVVEISTVFLRAHIGWMISTLCAISRRARPWEVLRTFALTRPEL